MESIEFEQSLIAYNNNNNVNNNSERKSRRVTRRTALTWKKSDHKETLF